MTKVLELAVEHVTFLQLQLQTCSIDPFKHFTKTLLQLLHTTAKDNDVIQVTQSGLEVYTRQHSFHEALEGCWRVGESKWHPPVLVEAKRSYSESCSLSMGWLNLHLMIAVR